MLFLRFALSSLVLATPLVSLAQQADPAPAPRFYVGLAAYSSYYQKLGGQAYRGARVPVQLTAGYQWRPRLAVQVSLAYSGLSYDYTTTEYLYTNAAGTQRTYFNFQGTSVERSTSVAVLARYTLTRKANHRLQVDLLGGLTLEHGSYRNYGTSTDSTQGSPMSSSYDTHDAHNSLLVTAGPSVRYRLGRQLELLYDLTANVSLASSVPYQIQGLTSGSALGLRYRFGQR